MLLAATSFFARGVFLNRGFAKHIRSVNAKYMGSVYALQSKCFENSSPGRMESRVSVLEQSRFVPVFVKSVTREHFVGTNSLASVRC